MVSESATLRAHMEDSETLPLFDRVDGRGPGYLSLMNMIGNPSGAIAAVRNALQQPDPLDWTLHLLRSPDWRRHLVAAVAIGLEVRDSRAIDTLWQVLTDSWAGPQLVAVAYLCDPTFEQRARQLVLSGKGGPKSLTALFELLAVAPGNELEWAQRELQARARTEREWVDGGPIAARWLERFRKQLAGLEHPPFHT